MSISAQDGPPVVHAAPSGRRQFGFWMCTALVIGNTIGIGIFVQPASLAPYGFNALIAWGITVLGCAMLAVVFATLARRLGTGIPNAYFCQGEGANARALEAPCVKVVVASG